MKNVEIKLRAHHGMCLAFFEGKGYSAGFTAHMAQVLEYLEQENPIIAVVAEADCICGSCPNLTDGRCRKAALVERYDKAVLALCGMGEHSILPWRAKSAAAVNGAASAKKKRLCTVCDFYGRINKR